MRRALTGVFWVAAACAYLVATSWIHYRGRTEIEGEFPLLIGLAFALGLMVGRWWALLFAPLPWLLGVGYGLYTGRYLFLGEAWLAIWIGSATLNLLGLAFGWLVNRGLATLPLYQSGGAGRGRTG